MENYIIQDAEVIHSSLIRKTDYEHLTLVDNRNGSSSDALSSDNAFILANTVAVDLLDIKNHHVIPVFVKDNEPCISHAEFIEVTYNAVRDVYPQEMVLHPNIRMSHPIKGRVFEARNKPASALEEWEKTLHYERMAFVFEIPSIRDVVCGNELSLTVGGVKSYSLDNLYNKKGADEHFKIFVGFQNKVCTNMCVHTDGFLSDLKVSNINQLKAAIRILLEGYNAVQHISMLNTFTQRSISEQQFANIIGRCRMYQYLPGRSREGIPMLQFGDQQINTVCRDYYKDKNFSRSNDGNINLWSLYNLLTGANKSTYIDQFVDRSVNAYDLVHNINQGLSGNISSWYLS